MILIWVKAGVKANRRKGKLCVSVFEIYFPMEMQWMGNGYEYEHDNFLAYYFIYK